MKTLVTLFALLVVTAHGQETYRTFTTADGRTLDAKLISCDFASGKTTIERKDRKRITVARSVFSAKDQRYIEKWATGQIFMAPGKLKLDLKREEVKSTKKDIIINLEDYDDGSRGRSGERSIGTDKKTQYRFLLSMENTDELPLDQITLEYRIYYAQEKAELNQEKSDDQLEGRPDIYEAKDELKVKEERISIKPIPAGDSKEVATQTITLLNRSMSGRDLERQINLKSKLHGAWIRLTMKGPDNQPLVREIAYPPSIPKKFPWITEQEQIAQ